MSVRARERERERKLKKELQKRDDLIEKVRRERK